MNNEEMNRKECEEKIFLQPGDIVTLKQDMPNKPTMMVIRKEMSFFRDNPNGVAMKGIRCRWFTSEGVVQEAVYSTKDLQLEKRNDE